MPPFGTTIFTPSFAEAMPNVPLSSKQDGSQGQSCLMPPGSADHDEICQIKGKTMFNTINPCV
jgi:hypothetical protein